MKMQLWEILKCLVLKAVLLAQVLAGRSFGGETEKN